MPTGLVTTFDLTIGTKVNMDDAIYVLSPIDSPMITGTDADGLSVLTTHPVDETTFSWMDEDLLIPRTKLSAVVTTGDAFIVVQAGNDRLKFSTGDLIMVAKSGASEILRVTGYGSTAASLTVTRGYDGTTATNYASGDTVIGLGTALAEGSNPENARSLDRTANSNYTQIFGPTQVSLSATEQVVAKYGVPNEFNRQVYNRMRENVVSREQAIIYGRATNSTTTKIRSMGGLNYFITTNVSAATQITVASIEALQQLGFNNGGVFDRLAANPKSLSDLNSTSDTARVRQEVADTRRGRVPVLTVNTEFGEVLVVRNRWVHPKDAFGFSREQCVRRVMRPLVLERLAKTGDSDQAQIVCEESLEVKGEEHMGKFNALGYADT